MQVIGRRKNSTLGKCRGKEGASWVAAKEEHEHIPKKSIVSHPVAWTIAGLGKGRQIAVKLDCLIRLPYLAMCSIGRFHERPHVTSATLFLDRPYDAIHPPTAFLHVARDMPPDLC